MSVNLAEEINKTDEYLQDSKQAILNMGGSISGNAGIKHLRAAISNPLLGSSIGDSTIHSTSAVNAVPEQIEQFVFIKKIGGHTFTYQNSADGQTRTRYLELAKIESRPNVFLYIDKLALYQQKYHRISIAHPGGQGLTLYLSMKCKNTSGKYITTMPAPGKDKENPEEIGLRIYRNDGESKRRIKCQYNATNQRWEGNYTLISTDFTEGIYGIGLFVYNTTSSYYLEDCKISLRTQKDDNDYSDDAVSTLKVPDAVFGLENYGMSIRALVDGRWQQVYNYIEYLNEKWYYHKVLSTNGKTIREEKEQEDITEKMQGFNPFLKVVPNGTILFFDEYNNLIYTPVEIKYVTKAGG